MTANSALGVDIGGVIITPLHEKSDTSFFSDAYLSTPPIENAFEVLSILNRTIFPNSVFLISKAKKETARKTLEWLAFHRFCEHTKIPLDKVTFVKERADKEEVAKKLNISAFIDDRAEVLSHLHSVPLKILFCPIGAPKQQFNSKDYKVAVGWGRVLKLLQSQQAK